MQKKMLPLTDRRALVVYLQEMRYRRIAFQAPLIFAYNLDGLDDRFVLANRAINPDGDIDIEWMSGPSINLLTSRTIISQTLTTNASSQEFFAFISTNGNLTVRVGGAERPTAPQIVYQPNTKYRWRLQGATVNLWVNDILQPAMTLTRGAAREPSAVTTIGATDNTFFYQGFLYNIRINGTLWPMADRNQTIQLPSPTGLGAELITQSVLENPAVKGSQWTYLGAGRWQLNGDGTLNSLEFITQSNQPNSGFLEFEIESITGTLVCSYSSLASSAFTTSGVKRYFYTNKSADINSAIQFKRSAPGIITSCIIKNISFKPLGTCNPMTGANLNSDRWVEIPL